MPITKAELEENLVKAHQKGDRKAVGIFAKQLAEERYIGGKNAPMEMGRGTSYGGQLARAGLRGALAGFGDEARAGFQAGLDVITGDPMSAPTTYQQVRDYERAQQQAFDITNPIASGAATVGGALMTAPVGGAAAPALSTAPAAVRYTAPAVLGALGGATAGAGEAPEIQDIPAYAGTGAAVGAVAGPVVGAVPNVASRITRVLSPTARTNRILSRAVGDMTPEEQAARIAETPGNVLGDVRGQATEQLESMVNQPGATSEVAGELFEKRSADQARQLLDLIDADDYLTSQEQIALAKRSAAPDYRKAYEQRPAVSMQWMRDFKEPAVQRLWKSQELKTDAMNDAFVEGLPYDPGMFEGEIPTVRGFDMLVRHVDGIVGEAKRAGNGAKVRQYTAMRKRLMEMMDEFSPDLVKARQQFAGPARQAEIIEDARTNFAKPGKVREIEAELKDLSPEEMRLYRVGAREALEQRISTLLHTHDVTKLFRNPNAERRMMALFNNNKEAYDTWANRVEGLANQQKAMRQVMGNSRTAARQSLQAEQLFGIAIDAFTGNPTNVGLGLLPKVTGLGGRSARDAAGRILLGTEPWSPPMMLPPTSPGANLMGGVPLVPALTDLINTPRDTNE